MLSNECGVEHLHYASFTSQEEVVDTQVSLKHAAHQSWFDAAASLMTWPDL